MLNIGDKAPAFSLPADSGGENLTGRFQGQDSRPFLFPQSGHSRLNERGEPVP